LFLVKMRLTLGRRRSAPMVLPLPIAEEGEEQPRAQTAP
jgi:hypothetical protein